MIRQWYACYLQQIEPDDRFTCEFMSVLLSASTDSDFGYFFPFLGMLVYEKFCEVLTNNARVRGMLTSPASCPKIIA